MSLAERGGFYALAEDHEPRPPESTSSLRLWREGPDRVREEREGVDGEPRLAVRDGQRWWSYDEYDGAITNVGEEEGDESESGVGEETRLLFDPAPLIPLLDFEVLGPGERAGRPVLRVHAEPRRGLRPDDRWDLNELAVGADDYELEVDAETGCLLRVEARRQGSAFSVLEAVRADFDETLPPQVFVFEPPPGEAVHPLEPGGVVPQLPLHEAAARASFTVFALERVPENWHLRVSYHAGRARPPSPTQVILWYRASDATTSLAVSQTSADARDDFGYGANDPPWEEVTRDGVAMRVRSRSDRWPQSQLTLVRDGTAITMTSDELPGRVLVDLAAALNVVSDAPPAV